jgi:hypothetical protein
MSKYTSCIKLKYILYLKTEGVFVYAHYVYIKSVNQFSGGYLSILGRRLRLLLHYRLVSSPSVGLDGVRPIYMWRFY